MPHTSRATAESRCSRVNTESGTPYHYYDVQPFYRMAYGDICRPDRRLRRHPASSPVNLLPV
ncbi:hypothetical protein CKO_03901 [Citrobacter koseri ATCC BAA-895]|uniref:Uncharacterized protein n=1 Tax=Citrobacter koseri (strain ATCC BAA-895 / CDC 4225-83 / SGSC4696) TaxID=290338 RepID=A8ANB4_CITK8|nr:hypothetical protein CKO_03901 [Citrobacter koseri ATCC BAA-895]